MTTQEIKVGLKFKEIRNDKIFEVTKITEKYVFYNTETYKNGWHQGKNKFLRKFNKFGASII